MIESTTILGRTRKYGDTIVAFRRPVEPLTAMSTPIPDEDLQDVHEELDDLLKIRLANSTGRRSRASYLIQRRYAWRGYSKSINAPTSATISRTHAACRWCLPMEMSLTPASRASRRHTPARSSGGVWGQRWTGCFRNPTSGLSPA